jgi:glycosyltransferase involved in cell wall biosynthesis
MTSSVIEVSIVTSGHDIADARLHRIVAGLGRAGVSVEVFALGRAEDGPAGAQLHVRRHAGFVRRLGRALGWPWRARGRVLMTLDPDALVGAVLAGAIRRRPVVSDVHEDYAALIRDRGWAKGPAGLGGRALASAANRLSRHCALTVVADEHVPPLQATHRLVVRNRPDPEMLPAGADYDPAPRAVYIGDLRRSRGLRTMVEAVSGAPGWTLDLIGPVAAADRSWLAARLAGEPDLAARVHRHGRQPPVQSWQIAAGAWAGLCLLEPTPAFLDTLPSKLYEYLAAGLVPIVTDLPRQRACVADAGVGYVVAGAADAATALRELAERRAELPALGARGRAWLAATDDGPGYDDLAERIKRLAHD